MSIKLLFTSSKIKNVERKFRGFDSVSWLFLAKDYKLLKKLDQGLSSKYRRVDISKIQNDVANDIRAKYVAWIDKLNELNGEDLGWWFNAISSRNTSETDLFQYACYLEVLKVLFTDRKSMPQLIIVESVGLAKAIEHWAKDIKIKIDIDGYRLAHMRRLKQYVYFFLKWLRYIGVVGARCYFAYITKKRNRREYNQIKQNIIVSTYVHDQDISEKGCFKDRYFPFLHEFLDEKGFSVMVHPVLHGFNFKFLSVFKRLRSSKTQFIIPEDNLRLYDYFLAFKNSLKSFINKIKLLPFNGLAMDSIVREETMVKFSASAIEATLANRLFLRISAAGIKFEKIIIWYENQVTQKALIAGTREFFPKTKIIGAQLFIHRPNLLSLFPSESEVKSKITPDLMLATSHYQCQVATSFTKAIDCRPAAALRYNHLFFDNEYHDTDQQTILVLLPFDIIEAVELLECVRAVVNVIDKKVRIVVKKHQDYTIKKLLKVLDVDKLEECFDMYDGSLKDILKQATVVVTANSGVSIEAMVKGIPVILMGRQTVLSQNNESDPDIGISTQCFSTEDLVTALNEYLNMDSNDIETYKKRGGKLRSRYFTPVNKETLAAFVSL